MPKKESEKEESSSEKPHKKSGGGLLLVIIILLLLLIIVGGALAAYFILFKKGSSEENAQQQPYSTTSVEQDSSPVPSAAAHGLKDEPGPILAYPPFLVNLADPGGNRYLKLTLSIELSKEKNFPAEVTAKEPRIKDIIVSVLASKVYDEISSTQGKVALKQELMRRLNTIMSGGRVTDIYITEFVVQ